VPLQEAAVYKPLFPRKTSGPDEAVVVNGAEFMLGKDVIAAGSVISQPV